MIKTSIKQWASKRKLPVMLLMTFGLAVGFSVMPMHVQSASAVSCRVTTNPSQAVVYGESDTFVGATLPRTVPGSSGCSDINVQNIHFRGYRSQYSPTCGTFRVRFYPSSGGSYVNSWRDVCSRGPNGPVRPIATGVANGTSYRLEYITNSDAGYQTPSPAYYYKLID